MNLSITTAKLIISLSLLLGNCHSSWAWSARGHKVIAEVAFSRLSNDIAAKVTAILGPNDLQHASIWPDLLRSPNDQEMRDFNAAHPAHETWHYVNLPLKATRYDPASAFARADDIVQMINVCIDVLEGQSNVMSQRHALRWLVHLVGDLHQPLHVGCGYYRFTDSNKAILIQGVTEAAGREHDRGGNRLRYTATSNQHSFWDDALVDRIDGSPGDTNLAAIIRSKIRPSSFRTGGAIRTWSAKWAIQSVRQSKSAYSGITFGEADFDGNGNLRSIVIVRPGDYADRQKSRAARQLAKGAFHLAELLNRIEWQ